MDCAEPEFEPACLILHRFDQPLLGAVCVLLGPLSFAWIHATFVECLQTEWLVSAYGMLDFGRENDCACMDAVLGPPWMLTSEECCNLNRGRTEEAEARLRG